MKSIKNIITICFLVFSFISYAQEGKIIKGEKSYETYSYSECIEKFEGITDKTYKIKKKLAESYFKTGDYINAEKYYKDIVKMNECTSEDVYNFASVLSINKKYPESEIWMDKFAALEKTDRRAQLYANNKGFYNDLLKDKQQFKINNLDINSAEQDFGTSYYAKQVVFASTRTTNRFFKRIWNWNQKPFLDLFIADNKNNQLVNVKRFKKTFNKKYHEGPASYTKDGKIMVFTRNNYNGKSRDGVVKLQVYFSEFKNNKWQKPIPFLYNSKEYSVGHAVLSADGNTMYLASDMPGGFGGVDIYKCKKDENGKWSRPINLGSKINTEGNEMFPFIHKDGFLFFASNGQLGLGGLDIFMSKIERNTFSKPINLGTPINSSTDDFAFIIDDELKTGFFSSNNKEGKGSDDIYCFKMLKPFGVIIKGTTKNEDGNILANTEVLLYNDNDDKFVTCITDSLGKFSFNAQPETNYRLLAKKSKFIDAKKNTSTKDVIGEIYEDLILLKISDFSLNCIVKDKKTKKVIKNANVLLQNKETNNIDELISSEKGTFSKKIETKKLNDNIKYKIVLTKEGYMVKSVNLDKILQKTGKQELTIFMDKMEIGMDLNDIIEINPIYFDLNKFNIRPDAAIELDKIIKVMIENPTMVIELGSHTDSRGSDSYNMRLSDKRAKSSAKYIRQRISHPDNIYGKGYGETQLKNHCKNGVKCSKKEHQENRRTEFKIIRK